MKKKSVERTTVSQAAWTVLPGTLKLTLCTTQVKLDYSAVQNVLTYIFQITKSVGHICNIFKYSSDT